MNCILFVKINDELKDFIDPNKIVEEMMEKTHNKNEVLSKHIRRIIPIYLCIKADEMEFDNKIN